MAFVNQSFQTIIFKGLEETVNCAEFKAMNLPTFYPFFIFLLRIAVDLVHQWLQTRSEKVISFEWDLLTLNTVRFFIIFLNFCHFCIVDRGFA